MSLGRRRGCKEGTVQSKIELSGLNSSRPRVNYTVHLNLTMAIALVVSYSCQVNFVNVNLFSRIFMQIFDRGLDVSFLNQLNFSIYTLRLHMALNFHVNSTDLTSLSQNAQNMRDNKDQMRVSVIRSRPWIEALRLDWKIN
ncbi:hypothetical protein T07_8997 [Trichinella nelsoni]|uniref:Uncharacterized protein n=1 Tax=Trichinella nelsoni TaxID=6336 RepID=A0A0V0REB0_9BILA|nr:hypothetical protein T07_8997 [Trichinella nelsoni]